VLVPALILDAPYVQRAIAELVLLALLAGVLGSWIVLRRYAFYTHAVGTATFPGLVVATPWGVAPQLTALAAALGFGAGIERLSRGHRMDPGAATGLLLVVALAAGSLLASDVYESGAGVDNLLFGTLIGLSERDVLLTAAAVVAALAAHGAMHRAWLATGFDPGSARALGVRTALADRVLLAAVAVAVVVSLDAVGALLVAVVLVVPAATVRLLARDVRSLQLGTAALAAAEGLTALLIADSLDIGPGPVMAVLGGVVFGLVAAVRR
jgi:ABC-type Mn2+/Zn2+ transport system permease subunit